MNSTLLTFALMTLGCAAGARGDALLYDNTTTDTGDTVFYSLGPYMALGDQIHLVSGGVATQAKVQMFNNGGTGTFDAELEFFDAGSTFTSPFGTFDLTGNSSAGSDVLNLTFNLGAGLTAPQDLIFTLSVSNQSANMDLGLDMFEPPTVGSSDNSFMIGVSDGITLSHLATPQENVYFQLSGTPLVTAPEAPGLVLLGSGLLVVGIAARAGRQCRPEFRRRHDDLLDVAS